jgi:hypothetical protein
MNKTVDFSIAKLLKEKGFDELCKLCVEDGDERPLPFNCGNTIHRNSLHPYYSAPTIAEVVMWLYEKYGIWIEVNGWIDQPVGDEIWKNCFQSFVNGDATDVRFFKTPTEAYKAAIEYTLENLI